MPDPAAYRRSAVPASTAGQGRPADAVAAELQLHEARPVDADRALCAGQAHRPAPGHSEVVQFLIAAVWGALLRLTVQGGTPGKQPSSRRCVPTTTGSACTPRCAARPTTDDRRPTGVGTTMPLHHPPGSGRRARTNQRCRANRAQAQVPLARRHHPPGDVAAGVHAAAGIVDASPATARDPFGVRVPSLREVSGPPLREPWCAGSQRQAGRAGGAARG